MSRRAPDGWPRENGVARSEGHTYWVRKIQGGLALYCPRAVVRLGPKFLVRPLENQCSALVRTAAMANGLIVLPEGAVIFNPGDTVKVQVLDWDSVVSWKQTAEEHIQT